MSCRPPIMTNASPANKLMTPGQLIMFGFGVLALVVGLVILLRSRRGTESQIYARRMIGTMGTALGGALIIFALGLSGKLGGAS